MMSRLLEFYTDGAWSSKTEMGGWAAICVEDGEIIGLGTHGELLDSCSVYREIYDSQFRKGASVNG